MEFFKDRKGHKTNIIDYVLCRNNSITRFSSFEGIVDALEGYNLKLHDCDIYYFGGHIYVDCD